jgi:hypothetical protein
MTPTPDLYDDCGNSICADIGGLALVGASHTARGSGHQHAGETLYSTESLT